MFGVSFIPAPDALISFPQWVIWLSGIVVTGPFACYYAWIFRDDIWDGGIKNQLLAIFSPPFAIFMTIFSINATFGVGIPMIHAAIFGNNHVIEYRITKRFGDGGSRDYCFNSVGVNVEVFGFSDLCGIPNELRKQMHRGNRILVKGHGSSAGVFYKEFELRR